jgi:hypothetical protein
MVPVNAHVLKYGAIGARATEAVAGANGLHPFRPSGVPKAVLREQAVAAMADYSGPITRCAPKRRSVP